MKALVIKIDHGSIWTAETTSGVRFTAASLEGLLGQMAPKAVDAEIEDAAEVLTLVFETIPESGSGQIAQGQASG